MKKAKQNKSKILLILAGLGLGAYLYFKNEKKESKEEQKQDEKKIGENILYPDFSELTETETEKNTDFAQDINTPLEFEKVDTLDNRKKGTDTQTVTIDANQEKDVNSMRLPELIEESGLSDKFSKEDLREEVKIKRLAKTNPVQADIMYILRYIRNHDYKCCMLAVDLLKKYSGTEHFTEIINTISNTFATDTEDKFIDLWVLESWNAVKQLMIDNNIELSEKALKKEKHNTSRNSPTCKHFGKTGLAIQTPTEIEDDESRIYSTHENEINKEEFLKKTLDDVKNKNNRVASSNTSNSYVGRSGSSSSSGRTGSGRISNVIKL